MTIPTVDVLLAEQEILNVLRRDPAKPRPVRDAALEAWKKSIALQTAIQFQNEPAVTQTAAGVRQNAIDALTALEPLWNV